MIHTVLVKKNIIHHFTYPTFPQQFALFEKSQDRKARLRGDFLEKTLRRGAMPKKRGAARTGFSVSD
ncbi:hypothetical protein [Chthoniobacter flavus]|uniref:hypothetical protein n=1 Tax=Chthoniobacter flavus TaxID=191863 RepID=UPI001053C883|nr:hypothetical protein [Chthoniobacter flavus]